MNRYRRRKITMGLRGTAPYTGRLLRCIALLFCCCLGGAVRAQGLLGSNPALPQIHARALAWADYDSDGDQDLLMAGRDANGNPATQLLRNDQTAFVPVPSPFHAWGMGAAAWGDLDSDGDPDLLQCGMRGGPVASGGGKGAVALWRNDGNAGFTALPCGLPGVRSGTVRWADLDGDGDMDCLLAGQNYDRGYVAVIGRNAGGALQEVGNPVVGFCCGDFAVSDLTGDNLPEVVALGENAAGAAVTTIWENQGGLRFREAGQGIPLLRNGSVDAGDMDGDGDGDLLLMGLTRPYTLGIWGNDSTGFQARNSLLQPGVFNGVLRRVDLDGDGLIDVVYCGEQNGGAAVVRALRQFPAGTFSDTQAGSPMLALHLPCIAIADWSGDGHPDLAVSGTDATGMPVALLYKWNNVSKLFEP